MADMTLPARESVHPHLRPLNILRDLPSVADLIELCFSQTMDNEGKRYLEDMRRNSADNSFIQWANRAAESTSLPLTGFVWEENGKIIGNVSLVPYRKENQRVYLIANVAVHPQHRRQGIARALTERAMQRAVEKNTRNVWLHVRDDNPAAIALYQKLGFVERARRTAWSASTDLHVALPSGAPINAKRNPRDWEIQRRWLERLYPPNLAWHRNWNFNALKPGFFNWLYIALMDMNVYQWAAHEGENLQAALAWIPSGRGEALFAALDESSPPQALTTLLIRARRELFHLHPRLSLDFPAGQFDAAIQAAGFRAARTLIWMQATL